jgi:ankyrin repeat protein
MLLGAGAGDGKRINRVTNSGNTSLHFACTGQHAEVASLLQLYKPDVYATNSYGQTPVSLGKASILKENKKSSIFTLPCFP